MPKIRKSYTVSKKLEIIDWHVANGSNLHKTSVEFGVARKCLRDWIKKEIVFKRNNFGVAKSKRKVGSGRKPLSEELDGQLMEFFEKERNRGRAVSNKLLSSQASLIATSIGITDFKASNRYIFNWKKRFSVTMGMRKSKSKKTLEKLKVEQWRLKENIQSNVSIHCDLSPFESENQVTQMIKQEISESQEILLNNAESNSNVGTSLDASLTPLTHLPYFESSCEVQIKQEPDQDSNSTSEHALTIISDCYSLTPCETLNSTACSNSTDEESSFESQIDSLVKNWGEKMKALRPDQRIYVTKLINQVFLKAEMDYLEYHVGN